jgi:hypothetical protein
VKKRYFESAVIGIAMRHVPLLLFGGQRHCLHCCQPSSRSICIYIGRTVFGSQLVLLPLSVAENGTSAPKSIFPYLCDTVTCRHVSGQCSEYVHATIERILGEVFSVWSAPRPVLGNGLIYTHSDKKRGVFYVVRIVILTRDMCFPWGPTRVYITKVCL